MRWCTYFRLLIWKNFLIKSRHKIELAVEIILPLIFIGTLVALRTAVYPINHENPTEFVPQPIGAENFELVRLQYPETIKWEIDYSPDHPLLEELVSDVASQLLLDIRGFNSSAELEMYSLKENPFVGVVFDVNTDDLNSGLPKKFTYRIRFPGELRIGAISDPISNWDTNNLFPNRIDVNGPRYPDEPAGARPGYIQEGFIAVQNAISSSYIKLVGNSSVSLPNMVMQRFPYPPYIFDPLTEPFKQTAGIMLILAFMFPCVQFIKHITVEKDRQLKEAMKIMGLSTALHWMAWFVTMFIVLFIIVAVLLVMLRVPWFEDFTIGVFNKSSWTLLLVIFVIYSMSCTTFCFMMSSFFTRATIAGPVSSLLWFITYIPFAFTSTNSIVLPLGANYVIALFLNSAMPMSCSIVFSWEGLNIGAQWNNLFELPHDEETFSLGAGILMMILDGILYLLITLYIEKIMPGSYGTAYKWYFPFTKSFWTNESKNVDEQLSATSPDVDDDRFENEFGNGNNVGIRLVNLRKHFGPKVAVDGLNMKMFENQITVLLGHNGAGKTTTISMITGLIPPTSGTAIVNGYNMLKDFPSIRKNLGFCPQYNVLFDELTVEEHIVFYGLLKGVPKNQIAQEVDKYLKRLELENKRNALSRTLSGGMKRKLSVGIALCGDSKFVLCDEPSAGMDPAARRALWQLLQREKKGRTILLTTHLMDEADVLGDRIAIMSEGKLACSGTPFFLKKRFGSGYKLICSKQPNCQTKAVTSLIQEFIPNVAVRSEVGTELTYELPEAYSKVFGPMLRNLESAQSKLGLNGYGISMASLEDVFLKTGTETEQNGSTSNGYHKGNSTAVHVDAFNIDAVDIVSPEKRFLYQWNAMFFKKLINFTRNWYLLVIQLIVPIIFIILGYFISETSNLLSILPPLKITLNEYDWTVTLMRDVASSGSWQRSVAQSYVNMFKSFPSKESLLVVNEPVNQALIALGEANLNKVNKHYMVAATIGDTEMIGWFNNQILHTAPLALNLIYNAIVKTLLGSDYEITVINDPLPLTTNYQLEKLKGTGSLAFQLSLNVTFAMAYVSSIFIMFLITERVSRAKLLQLVSGVRLVVFWTVHFITDFLVYILIACFVTLVMFALQLDGFKTGAELGQIFVVFVLYGFAALPVSYLASFYFDEPAAGLARLSLLHVLTGNALFILAFILSIINVNDTLHQVAIIFPNFALAQAISFQSLLETTYSVCSSVANQMHISLEDMCTDVSSECCNLSPFGWDKPGIGKILAFMVAVGFGLILILAFKETRSNRSASSCCSRVPPLPDETKADFDDDVQNEKQRVANLQVPEIQQTRFVAKDLTKFYKKFLAVNRLSVSINSGECFGLLGVNGAGKTSAFKMMVGDETISHGDVWINGINVQKHTSEIYQYIGYCPQYDALLSDFTGMEMLRLFATLRGIPLGLINPISRQIAVDLAFERHLNKKVGDYSGGNRRKLSTAIALLGNPHVIYLDEPTAGIDPASRRKLWDMVCRFRDMGKAIILTSHSMEESEALCTRIGIMVNGEFKCIGSSQHLKNKYSPGRSLTIKLGTNKNSTSGLVMSLSGLEKSGFDLDERGLIVYRFIVQNLQGANLKDYHKNLLTFELPGNTMPYSQIFGLIESNKQSLGIEDYSLSQGTLEQVFLSFTNNQRESS